MYGRRPEASEASGGAGAVGRRLIASRPAGETCPGDRAGPGPGSMQEGEEEDGGLEQCRAVVG